MANIVGTMLAVSRCAIEQGRIVQWYGLSVDIDERKKAEQLLRRSEAYLAEAQRLSHSGTCGPQSDNDAISLLVGRELPNLGV